MPDDNRTVLASDRLSEPPGRGRYSGGPPEPPDQNKMPLLPYYERFPHLRPPPRRWRRTLRQRLAESGR
jgi:hypothetical protein